MNARRLIPLLCLATLSSAAAETREVVLPGGERVIVASELCAALAVDPDAASYRPGIDAEGRPVTPADLPGTAPPIGAPSVEILADPRRFGASTMRGIAPLARLGYVTVENGSALLDGRPLADEARARLLAACGR